jgi:hypothetical protein
MMIEMIPMHVFRGVLPVLLVGLGFCFMRDRQRRCRARMRRMDRRQEEMLQTLKEIRDAVREKAKG